MSRAVVALVLLAAPLLAAAAGPAEAQPPGYSIPTQREFPSGGVNVTTWVMRDTRAISFTPGVQENPLNYLWNLNFTAGSLGVFYAKAVARDEGAYVVEARLRSPSSLLQVVGQDLDRAGEASRACTATEDRIRCELDPLNHTREHAYQFFLAASAEPGVVPLTLEVRTFRNTTGTPVLEAETNTTYRLVVIDPVPPFAVQQRVGNTTVYGWLNGGTFGLGSTGCLGGASVGRDANVSLGAPAVVCVLAIHRAAEHVRVAVDLAPPEWMRNPSGRWTSPAFNATSGGAEAPVTSFQVTASPQAPLGPAEVVVRFVVERQQGEAWVAAGEGSLALPFAMVQGQTVVVPSSGLVNWLVQAPILAAAVGGLGYLAYKNRRPKIQPRSQAMREELARKTGRRAAAEGEGDQKAIAAQVEQQRQEVQEAAWDKKRKILEAKREDVLKSIRIADERRQRGEITDHVFQGIKERKERQLEQVEQEMQDLR